MCCSFYVYLICILCIFKENQSSRMPVSKFESIPEINIFTNLIYVSFLLPNFMYQAKRSNGCVYLYIEICKGLSKFMYPPHDFEIPHAQDSNSRPV